MNTFRITSLSTIAILSVLLAVPTISAAAIPTHHSKRIGPLTAIIQVPSTTRSTRELHMAERTPRSPTLLASISAARAR